MPIQKQSLNNFLPDGFETLNQEGYKENFSEDKIKTGYEKDIKDRVSGPNFNNLIDVVGKNTNTLNSYVEYLNGMPINNVPTVNEFNQLDYTNLDDKLTKKQITNCILEIPQRIKYTLENGILTIKAGSVVIVPYGVEDLTAQYPVGATFLNDKFKVYGTQFADGKFFVWAELVNDFIGSTGATTKTEILNLLNFTEVRLDNNDASRNYSGDTPPAITNVVYYNTKTNLIYGVIDTNGTSNNIIYSLPILKTIAENKVFTSVNHTFNGMGYIGSTVWVDKGVKGLIPNGRNEDGSLNNIEVTSDKLYLRTYATGVNNTNVNFIFQPNNTERPIGYVLLSRFVSDWEDINYLKDVDGTIYQGFMCATCDVTNGVITSFNPKQPVNLATKDMVDGQWVSFPEIIEVGSPKSLGVYTFDISNYLPNDGYIYDVFLECGGKLSKGGTGTIAMNVSSSVIPHNCKIAQMSGDDSANQFGGVAIPLPIGTDRVLTVSLTGTSGVTLNESYVYLYAYRRLGTNL